MTLAEKNVTSVANGWKFEYPADFAPLDVANDLMLKAARLKMAAQHMEGCAAIISAAITNNAIATPKK